MSKISKVKWCLLGCVVILAILVITSMLRPVALTDTVRSLANSKFATSLRGITSNEELSNSELIEMTVERVGLSKVTYQPVVILKEKEGEVYLPIWIGIAETDAISAVLDKVEFNRPLTADLLYTVLRLTGGSVKYVIINGLRDNVFYANIVLNADWTETEIDARPSDAIAIALRFEAPIYIKKTVLDKAGVVLDQEESSHGESF